RQIQALRGHVFDRCWISDPGAQLAQRHLPGLAGQPSAVRPERRLHLQQPLAHRIGLADVLPDLGSKLVLGSRVAIAAELLNSPGLWPEAQPRVIWRHDFLKERPLGMQGEQRAALTCAVKTPAAHRRYRQARTSRDLVIAQSGERLEQRALPVARGTADAD